MGTANFHFHSTNLVLASDDFYLENDALDKTTILKHKGKEHKLRWLAPSERWERHLQGFVGHDITYFGALIDEFTLYGEEVSVTFYCFGKHGYYEGMTLDYVVEVESVNAPYQGTAWHSQRDSYSNISDKFIDIMGWVLPFGVMDYLVSKGTFQTHLDFALKTMENMVEAVYKPYAMGVREVCRGSDGTAVYERVVI